MSQDYASSLSEYENKGVCGISEVHDPPYLFEQKVTVLTDLLRNSSYTVVHTGAGLSTAAGIPDFRGPNGVWTLERQGKKPSVSKSFAEARPTVGHMALVALERAGYIHFLITQNIDGLHLRSGFPRNRLSILHGDAFIEKCESCGANYVRSTNAVPTFGLKETGSKCTKLKTRIRACGGRLRDTVLDWEDELTEPDYANAVKESRNAILHLCLGLSPDFLPSALLPFRSASLGIPRMYYTHRTKLENAADTMVNTSTLDSFDLLISAPNQLTDDEVDEYVDKYLASDAHLTNGEAALSSMYLAPPQGVAKRFKWTRRVNSRSVTSSAPSGARNGCRGLRRKAQLNICLGTSLQIHPAADLPFSTNPAPRRKRKHPDDDIIKLSDTDSPNSKHKVVIVNLQPTKFDTLADFCLRTEIDRVLTRVCENLGVEITGFKEENEDGSFVPKIVLRSKHTLESEKFPWIILSHPENTASPFADDGGDIRREDIADTSRKGDYEDEAQSTKKEELEADDQKPLDEISQ